MPQDAAASGAESDADSTKKGESDAGNTGGPDIEKIVASRVAQKLKGYGDLDELKTKAANYDSLQESQKTETQKLADKIAVLEAEKANWATERKSDRVQTETVREAARLGFRDPADAYRLLDVNAIEFDGDQPKNVGRLLGGLLKDKPYLASVNGSADGGQRGESSDGKQPSMNELIRAAAKGH